MNFKTPRRTLLQDLHTLGGKKKTSYPGHNSISFSSKCRKRSSGEKSKVLSNKRSFQGWNVFNALSSSSLTIHSVLTSTPLTNALICDKNRWVKLNKQHLTDAAVTDTPVTLGWLCLAAHVWHFHCFLSFSRRVIWQWSGVINCSIKATLRIQNTLDAQPLGMCCPITLKDKTPSCFWQSTSDSHRKTNGFI